MSSVGASSFLPRFCLHRIENGIWTHLGIHCFSCDYILEHVGGTISDTTTGRLFDPSIHQESISHQPVHRNPFRHRPHHRTKSYGKFFLPADSGGGLFCLFRLAVHLPDRYRPSPAGKNKPAPPETISKIHQTLKHHAKETISRLSKFHQVSA